MSIQLSINDILKDAQRVHEFRGDESYALTSFLREVDTIFSIIQSNLDVQNYIYKRVILNKLQGEALHVIRTLGPDPSWLEVKTSLISNFGVKESYHQLYQDAFSIKNFGIENYYKNLRQILCKLNEKYEYDVQKPIEFSPVYVEKIILKTFLNNIDVNLASVVINRNISKLRDAYNLLEQEGLLRTKLESKTIFNYQNYSNRNGTQNIKPVGSTQNYKNHPSNQNVVPQSRFYKNPDKYQNVNSASSSRFVNHRQNLAAQNRNLNHSISYNSNRYNPNLNYNRNENNDMDIDHIEVVADVHAKEDINFHTIAYKSHFQ